MTSPRTILLVEDNADDADLTMRAFKKHMIANQVVHVSDGAEALEYLFGTGRFAGQDTLSNLSVVLLDLNLPKLSGLDVLKRIRADARTRRVPVVVLTSSNEDRDIVASYDLGANSFVRKPVDFAEFVDASRQLGLYWLVLNQQPSTGASR